ncbi:MAG: hypothetical protein ACR2NJ_07005 [Acidimicrobiales bacterium]
MYYNAQGEVSDIGNDVQPSNPQPAYWLFGYDSNTRMTAEIDPLPWDVIAANTRSDCASWVNCATIITYDSSGRTSTVTSPAPLAANDNTRPERGYCYGFGSATITSGATAPTCSGPAPRVTSVAVAGLSPSVGYAEQDSYDNQNRITTTRDSAGLATTYTWNSADQVTSTVGPAGVETGTGYDNQNRPIHSYGPAPAASFAANGQPAPNTNVATSTTTYDGGLSGLAAAWYANPNLAGTPALHTTSNLAENWAGGTSPSSGTAEPGLIPASGFSGNLTGLANLPSAGRLSLTADGGTVSVDGHQVADQSGGPYAGAVRADQPGDWWRLGEPAATTVAADSAGQAPGSYSPTGVSLAQPGPLADADSSAAGFDGTSGTVSVPDRPSLQVDNSGVLVSRRG